MFLPLVLLALVVLGSLLSDVYQAYRAHRVLVERNVQLDASVNDARNVRLQFDTLVKGVATLAGSGNANASTVMTALNKAGVQVNVGEP